MDFNKHSDLANRHATLAPSTGSWVRYDFDKMRARLITMAAARRGSEMHALACEAIRLRIKFQGRTTIAAYVNDAIGFKMTPEQPLFATKHCFGTADAIGLFYDKKIERYILRIFDLKTGETPVKKDQLMIYAAIFCIEYGFKPFDLIYDLRIYQMNEIITFDEVTPEEIVHYMDRILTLSRFIDENRDEVSL